MQGGEAILANGLAGLVAGFPRWQPFNASAMQARIVGKTRIVASKKSTLAAGLTPLPGLNAEGF